MRYGPWNEQPCSHGNHGLCEGTRIDATVTVADIGSVKSIDADIILTTKSMASHISDDIRSRTTVMYVTNLIKKDEINAKLDEFFAGQDE